MTWVAVKRPDPENSKGVRYYFSPVQFVEVLPLPATETSINRLDHVGFHYPEYRGPPAVYGRTRHRRAQGDREWRGR
jgi:hypothetical protein